MKTCVTFKFAWACLHFTINRKLFLEHRGVWQKIHHNLVATNTRDTQSQKFHDTMGWKPNFQFSYQTFCSPCQITHTSWSYIPRKATNKISEKKDKNEGRNEKVLLPL
jgi:hypothetical protein